MSPEIASIICDHAVSRSRPLMIIASRNQSDYFGHYSCDPDHLAEMASRTNGMVMLCRDHCGPFFKDCESGQSVSTAMDNCLRTIDNDARLGFSVVHIDPSRIPDQQEKLARQLIERCLQQNPNVLLEYGSEGIDDQPSDRQSLDRDLMFIAPYQRHTRFIVAKTGSLVRDGQIGNFDEQRVLELSNVIKDHGFHLKEHNADYLDAASVSARWRHGVSAMNVAPQLGYEQTRIMMQLCQMHNRQDLWIALKERVLQGQEWRKWCPGYNPDRAAVFSGHYYRNSVEAQRIVDLDQEGYLAMLTSRINDVIDTYHSA